MTEQRSGPEFVTQQDIIKTPKSNWYCYTLFCRHKVYSRVRISFKGSFNQHFVRCPQGKHEGTEWQPVETVEAVSDEHVSDVHDGSSFILPNRIMRTDGPNGTTGSPFPYSSGDRDY